VRQTWCADDHFFEGMGLMLIKEKMAKLTNGEVKKLVTDAVAAEKIKKSKPGAKLLVEYNKLYVQVLKFQKLYDVRMSEVEKSVKATVGKDIDDDSFVTAQKNINDLRKEWAGIISTFDTFEKVEVALRKEYNLKS
jgi:hypothetical protein